jgi:hypothetical protein
MNDKYLSNVTRGYPIISEKRSRLYVVTPGKFVRGYGEMAH